MKTVLPTSKIALVLNSKVVTNNVINGKKNCCENLTLNWRKVVVVFRDAWRMRLKDKKMDDKKEEKKAQ